jgi:uncharacterized membrane protein
MKKTDGKEEKKYGGTLIAFGFVFMLCGALLLKFTSDQKLGETGLGLLALGGVAIILGFVDLFKN